MARSGRRPQARIPGAKIPARLAPLFAARQILRPKPRAEIQAALAAGALPAVFAVRFVPLDTAGLHVSSRRATDADLERLLVLRENLAELDLSRAPVTDRALATIGRLTNLQSLRLDRTCVTDVGVAALAPLSQLASLNLNATRLTDQALSRCAS